MTYKYINIHLLNADPIVARDATMKDDGDQFITIETDRILWRINTDQIRYIRISKSGDE